MLILLHTFYSKVYQRIKDHDPEQIFIDTDMIRDLEFTPNIFGNLKELLENDGGYAWRHIMREVDEEINQHGDAHYICDSETARDPIEHGEFNYYTGWLNPSVPFLFAIPPFPWVALPTYLTLYDPVVTIDLRSDKPDVLITPTNVKVLEIMHTKPFDLKQQRVIEMLRNSDRPKLA